MNTQQLEFSGVRPAAVAGYFYPDDPGVLSRTVSSLLEETQPGEAPKAIIAPHAGYIYSGAVAARAYSQFQTLRERVRRVVLLGPAHRVYVRGLALCSAGEFSTPLGSIPVDQEEVSKILQHPAVCISDAAHAQEHSLEVHLPFLQMLFEDFSLVPLVVGDANPEDVADVLELLWGGDETIIVISSDLSHFHDYDSAVAIDKNTAAAIESFDNNRIGSEQACGCMPMGGLLTVARRKSMKIVNYDLKNSGDTAGDRKRVVGYGAWGLY